MQADRSPVVLLLDLSSSALAGIDLLSFTVTSRFRGIKDLPQGLHFVFTGSSNAFSVRHGIWFNVQKGASGRHPLIITRWRSDTEALVTELDEAENLRWRANVGEFWREGLTPYRQSASDDHLQNVDNDWGLLTSCITPRVLSRITGGDQHHWALTSASSAARDRDDIPGIRNEDFNAAGVEELVLFPIDLKQTWRIGATGRERTAAATDRSWALSNIVQQHANGNVHEIIGELQFCFLMTLTLNNWSCFEQWKRVLTLVFTCQTAVSTQADFFVHFIAALRLQLQHMKDAEGGLIDMTDEGESLLKALLVRFRKGITEAQVLDQQDVIDELDDLEVFLGEEYGWEFGGSFAKSGVLDLEDGEQVPMDTTAYDEDDETGEYAPQVVDLSREQRRLLDLDDPQLLKRIAHTSLADSHDNMPVEQSDEEEESGDLDDLDQRF